MYSEIVETIITKIKDNELIIQNFRDEIKVLFNNNTDILSKSNFKITKEVKDNYDKIDFLFGKKSKLESEVYELKKSLYSELLK